MTDMNPKTNALLGIVRDMPSAVLAYSGGVDGTFLLKILSVSGIRALAVTSGSETTPPGDLAFAKDAARLFNIEHLVIITKELKNHAFSSNPPDRCYHCKDELFFKLSSIAKEKGYAFVMDGSNLDDTRDYRPGRRAAEKHGVRSPLIEAGFTKADIREASRGLGVPGCDRPASPCLSSRFPYGTAITVPALRMVEEAEEFLKSLGFTELRVRHMGRKARIELLTSELSSATEPAMKEKIVSRLRLIGYEDVSFDPEGFRSGNLNKAIQSGESSPNTAPTAVT